MDRSIAAIMVMVTVLASALVSGSGLGTAPRAAVTITLYGDTNQGWGFTTTDITTPGPTITVNQSDSVTINLYSVSGKHNWFADYNGNGQPDAGEPISPDFDTGTPGTITFDATTAGSFTYYCDYHAGKMYGTFVVQATNTNTPPTAAVSMPDGAQDWTGGTVHRIWWNMSDAEDANAALTVFLNYTSAGGSGAIAGPLPGTPNPISFDWTVPSLDAGDVMVNLTVVDSGGLRGWADAPVPVVDSTPPVVAGAFPVPDSTGVPLGTNVQVTWSEAMEAVVTGAPGSFGLQEVAGGGWVPGTFAWNAPLDTVMTFNPTANLAASTQYRGLVNVSARDDSDPGNAVGSPYTWTFTTGNVLDTEPPTIAGVTATPTTQVAGSPLNVSATVTDNVGVGGVWLEVQAPGGGATNASMARGPGDTYFLERAYSTVGIHAFTIWASDTSNLWNSAGGQFEVTPANVPTIEFAPPMSVDLGAPLNLTATVTHSVAMAEARLNFTDTEGVNRNVSMDSQGSSYWHVVPAQLRARPMSVFVWARGVDGNVNRTPVRTVSVQAPAGYIVLYGNTNSGWGFGPDNLSSPGPTVRVTLGATVNVLILSADRAPHNFYVDYDGDLVPDMNEPKTVDARDTGARITFVADREGTFSYRCEYHLSVMVGTLVVEPTPSAAGFPWLPVAVGILAVLLAVAAVVMIRRRKGGRPPRQD